MVLSSVKECLVFFGGGGWANFNEIGLRSTTWVPTPETTFPVPKFLLEMSSKLWWIGPNVLSSTTNVPLSPPNVNDLFTSFLSNFVILHNFSFLEREPLPPPLYPSTSSFLPNLRKNVQRTEERERMQKKMSCFVAKMAPKIHLCEEFIVFWVLLEIVPLPLSSKGVNRISKGTSWREGEDRDDEKGKEPGGERWWSIHLIRWEKCQSAPRGISPRESDGSDHFRSRPSPLWSCDWPPIVSLSRKTDRDERMRGGGWRVEMNLICCCGGCFGVFSESNGYVLRDQIGNCIVFTPHKCFFPICGKIKLTRKKSEINFGDIGPTFDLFPIPIQNYIKNFLSAIMLSKIIKLSAPPFLVPSFGPFFCRWWILSMGLL